VIECDKDQQTHSVMGSDQQTHSVIECDKDQQTQQCDAV